MEPFTGELTVENSEVAIKSIEIQLVRVETCGMFFFLISLVFILFFTPIGAIRHLMTNLTGAVVNYFFNN